MSFPTLRICGVASALLWCATRAQVLPAPITLETVEVTGTRLGRSAAESPTSITVISHAELERSGRARLAEVLRELPEIPGTSIGEMVAFNESRGVTAVDLRGLGAGNTLVLVNGRRTTVNANAFDLITTYVDMNRFSPAMIERVEIMKGGASAIYGADAVGGVINIITRRQPQGGEATLSYGNTFKTDAAEMGATLAIGLTRGPLGLSIGIDYFRRNAQAHRDRSFTQTSNLLSRYASAYDFYAQLPRDELANYDGRSLNSANARFSVAPDQVNGRNGVNIPGLPTGAVITTLPGTGSTATSGLASATPNFANPFRTPTGGQFNAATAASFVTPELTRGDPAARNLFDFNQQIWTLPEATRTAVNARADYEIGDYITLFAETAGGRNRSRTEYHPRDFNGVVPRTNAFNPFGVDVAVGWRMQDAGPRRSLTEDDSFSALVGARSGPRKAIRWEIAGSYSRDEYIDVTRNVLNGPRALAALASSNPSTALNPFAGGTYRHDPSLIEALRAEAWFGGRADLLTFDAQAAGTLFLLPMGPVRIAGLVEQRRERISNVSDALSRSGDILGFGQTGADSSSKRDVSAVAAEARIPLLASRAGQNQPARLAVEAAARLEDFGRFRSGVQPSVGVVAHPAHGITLRATEAWTFRAPTLPQLFSPQSDTFYNSIVDRRRPVALTGDPFDGPNVSRLVRQGGNPDLQPETGRVLQLGGGWQPARVSGLTLEATWYRYDLKKLISGVGPDYILMHELDGLGSLVHRQPGSETYTNRTTSPIAVQTGAAGQTSLVAPGASSSVPGRIARIDIFTVNLSRRQFAGWDFGVRHTQRVRGADVIATAGASYTDKNEAAYDDSSPMVNYAGWASNPRWRGRGAIEWSQRSWSVGTSMAYTASSGQHTADSRYQKPYRVVHLHGSYTCPERSWLGKTQFSLGIDDVFDETPPLYLDPPIAFNYGAVARPQGRFWRITAKRTW